MNLKTYQFLSVITGFLAYMIYYVYTSAIQVMYPISNNSFDQMFSGLTLLALLIGIFLPINRVKSSMIGLIILTILSIASFSSGSLFSTQEKTDEFLIYFLLVSSTTLSFIAGGALLVRNIIFKSNLNGKEIFQLISSMIFGVVIGLFIMTMLGEIEVLLVWAGITTLLILSIALMKKNLSLT